MDDVRPIRRALLSVSDKRGLIDLAQALAVARRRAARQRRDAHGAGRGRASRSTEVSAYTGQPEILGGRVKTLHPKLHGGILARRDVPDDLAALEAQGIEPIDLVVVNLYPFEATVARPGVDVRRGDREHRHRRPEPDPGRGQEPRARRRRRPTPTSIRALIDQLRDHGGTTLAFRRDAGPRRLRADRPLRPGDRRLPRPGRARRAQSGRFPPTLLRVVSTPAAPLRYGENPHQRAAFYVEPGTAGPEPRHGHGPCTARSSRTTTCSTSTAPCG